MAQDIEAKKDQVREVADRIRALEGVTDASIRPGYDGDTFRAFFDIDDGHDPMLARVFFMQDGRSGERVEAWIFLERGTIATGYRSLATRSGISGDDGVPIGHWPDAVVDLVAENIGEGTAHGGPTTPTTGGP